MLKEFKQLKEEYPDRILIASIMEEYNKAAWEELIDRVEQTGVVRCVSWLSLGHLTFSRLEFSDG